MVVIYRAIVGRGVLQRSARHSCLYLCPFHLFYRRALRLPASTANLYLLALTRVRREFVHFFSRSLLRESRTAV